MTEFLLYAMDEAGRTGLSETLHGCDRANLRTLAQERLRDWHVVEVWDGPMCVVRLRRTKADRILPSSEDRSRA